MSQKKGRITGIGGVFFKCDDPNAIKKWYAENFQLDVDKYGTMFKFYQENNPDRLGYLQWSPFSADTDYFSGCITAGAPHRCQSCAPDREDEGGCVAVRIIGRRGALAP